MKDKTKLNSDSSVKERILSSAIEVFSSQGRQGARMEHIALHAGVNKALLYYHFRNRDELYRAAFKQQFQLLISEVMSELGRQAWEEEEAAVALKQFIRAHFRAVSRHKRCVRLFIGGTADDPAIARVVATEMIAQGQPPLLSNLLNLIDRAVQRGQFRAMNPKQLLISIVSLNLFFFVARPIAETFLDLQIEDEELFLEERLTSILDLVLYGTVERRA